MESHTKGYLEKHFGLYRPGIMNVKEQKRIFQLVFEALNKKATKKSVKNRSN